MPNLSGPTLIVILLVVLLLFGAPRLPALAKSIGQSMKILRKEVSGDGEKGEEKPAAETAPSAETVAPATASVEDELAKARAEAAAAKAEAEALRAAAEQRGAEDSEKKPEA